MVFEKCGPRCRKTTELFEQIYMRLGNWVFWKCLSEFEGWLTNKTIQKAITFKVTLNVDMYLQLLQCSKSPIEPVNIS